MGIPRSERLPRISEYLRARGGPVTVAALAQTFGVARRTLFRDLAILRSEGVSICGSPARGGGVSIDASLPTVAKARGSDPDVTSRPFIGYEREFDQVRQVLERAVAGHGAVAVVCGEPGMGKTRLGDELSSYGQSRGAQVLWARCPEEPGAPPYWAWSQVIRAHIRISGIEPRRAGMGSGRRSAAHSLLDAIEEPLDSPPAASGEHPGRSRFRTHQSLASFLWELSQAQPLLLILDNLHQADTSSLRLLDFLSEDISDYPILIVGTYRDADLERTHPLTRTLGNLARQPVFTRVRLNGLSGQGVGELVEAITDARPPARLVEEIFSRTEGNPFFVEEVARDLLESGRLAPGGNAREGERTGYATLRIPDGVREAVGSRLSRLSERCIRMLTVASVLGRAFTVAELARLIGEDAPAVADQSREELMEVLEEACLANVILEASDAPGEYRFAHVLIQDTLREELSPRRRAQLNATVAHWLESHYGQQSDAHAARLARHCSEARTVLGTDGLIHYSQIAGNRALAAHAYAEAQAHFEAALGARYGTEGDLTDADLYFGLGRAQASNLEHDELPCAISSLTRAFDLYLNHDETERALEVAQTYFPLVRGPIGFADIQERALAFVPRGSVVHGRILASYAARLAYERNEYAESARALREARAVAAEQDDDELSMRVHANVVAVQDISMNLDPDMKDVEAAIELATRLGDPFVEIATRFWASRWALGLGDFSVARKHAAMSLALAEKVRDRHLSTAAIGGSVRVSCMVGDWAEAARLADRGLAVDPHDIRCLSWKTIILYEIGDFAGGETYLRRMADASGFREGANGFAVALTAYNAANALNKSGRLPEIGDVESVASDILAVSGPDDQLKRRVARAALVLIATERNDSEAAASLYGKRVETPVNWGLTHGGQDGASGRLAATAGRTGDAAAHFEAELARSRDAGYGPSLAWTCHDYAETLLNRAGPGDLAKADALVREAAPIADELGMMPLRRKLAALEDIMASSAGRPAGYPAGLSEREVEILRLVARGMTNREIARDLVLSERTVQRHISNLYTKIDVRNRAEATAFALKELPPAAPGS